MTSQTPLDPTIAFAELGRIKPGGTDLGGVLARVAELAKRALPGAAEVSITLVRDRTAYTAASTGDLALRLDQVQYDQGIGPSLQACVDRTTLVIEDEDMADATRWPQWSAEAIRAGVRSSLTIGLPLKESVAGALNVYAAEPDVFDDDVIVLARTFAGYAAVALANAHLYDTTATLAQHMQATMESRAVIEQAKGIIMGARRCTAAEAFAVLSVEARDSHRRLREVAVTLVSEAQVKPAV